MGKKTIPFVTWTLAALLYFPILLQLYRSRWENIDYTHAYFILPVALFLAWQKRKKLAELTALPEKASTIIISYHLLIFASVMFIFGWRQDYLFITTLSMIPFLFGVTAYLYGAGVSRALAFPILYLLLMVPPPLGVLDSITLPMRYGVSFGTEAILKMFHYPITLDGLTFSVKGHEIYMGAPCSGFRSLITMLSLGLAYSYISKTSTKNKLIMVGSIIPLALAGNLLRIVGVCTGTYHFGPHIGEKIHDFSGYAIFLVLILGLMGIETLLKRHEHQ